MIRKLVYLLPKPVLFGLLGGVGCFMGWLFGEPLLSVVKPRAGQKSDSKDQAPILVFGNEFKERQEREGAKSGDVQVTLIWNNFNDLDLHCIDPNQEHIYFSHKKAASGGELDVDMNASSPFSTKPVENIFWPTNGAPLGQYQIMVHHYALHGGADPTVYVVGLKANGQVREFKGAISHNDPTNTVCTFAVKPPALSLIDALPRGKVAWLPTVVIGCWSALLAIFLSLLLVMGQNALLRRKLMTTQSALTLVKGGIVAGLVSGAVSQYLFSTGAQALAARFPDLSWLLKVGQVVGWMVLGGLLGWGMGIFIPNLPRAKASLAGLVGGLMGALAFLYALKEEGDTVGRLIGSVILGVSIGWMVALVERLAREAALVVHWDANERTIINLGPTPVVLGSSPEAHLYLPAERGFPPETAVVTFVNGVVELENRMTETRHVLHNGNKLEIGDLIIEIQTDK